jgi:hypothetical protein
MKMHGPSFLFLLLCLHKWLMASIIEFFIENYILASIIFQFLE